MGLIYKPVCGATHGQLHTIRILRWVKEIERKERKCRFRMKSG